MKKDFKKYFRVSRRTKTTIDKYSRYLSKVADIIFTIKDLKEKPGKIGYAAAGVKGLEIALSAIEINDEDSETAIEIYMRKNSGKWICVEELKACQSYLIQSILKKYFFIKKIEDEDIQDEYETVCSVHIDGKELIWSSEEEDHSSASFFWCLEENKDFILNKLSEIFWKDIGSNNCLVTLKKDRGGGYGGDIHLINDVIAKDILESEVARDISAKIKKYLDHPEIGPTICRSLILHGRPGTGKSTALRYIVKNLDLRSVKIPFEIITYNDDLLKFLSILKPQCVIIDDIDRSTESSNILNKIEYLRKYCRVILASANDLGVIDGALLRPGRFDESITVNNLEENIIKNFFTEDEIKDIGEETFAKLKEMPVAYINEFALRRKVLGNKEAIESITDIYDRVEKNNNRYGYLPGPEESEGPNEDEDWEE